jgi:diaminopimelate epimerase
MELRFVKMHGLGNDFVVFEDLNSEIELSPEAIEWFCDRHFGVGGDGVILVRPATRSDADFYMAYYNSDGSIAEMCGNGVRCFAKYVVDHGLIASDCDELVVETLGGLKPISVTRAYDGTLYLATVDMGEPILVPADVPTGLRNGAEGEPVVSASLETSVGTFEVTTVSMGNPHCVQWVDDAETADVEGIGPVIETHDLFPARTNVEFAELVDDTTIRLRVWERGCGETLACGTGACATVVAASLTGRLADRRATVQLPGGDLDVHWAQDGHVYMTGPATEVFVGQIAIPEDDETDA